MLTIAQIRWMLEDRRLKLVAKRAGLTYPTLRKIVDGEENVTDTTLTKIRAYLSQPMPEA